MSQEKLEFRYYQRVIVKRVRTSNGDYLDMTGYFIKELTHLPEYFGKCLVIVDSVQLIVEKERLEIAPVQNYDR